MKRAILIVMDGCGAGFAPDSEAFGDFDSPNTLGHVWSAGPALNTPILSGLGLWQAAGVDLPSSGVPGFRTGFGRMQEVSQGKDSVTGHWEMMGILTEKAFPTYPKGFPIPLIKEFEKEIGTQVIGNRSGSGTEIIAQLGQMHMETGFPIVYTSADSVFQIAAHEDIVPLEKLYEMCVAARKVCVAPDNVQRVIARPFIGNATQGFVRTGHRKDYPMTPPSNLIDSIGDVFGVGVVPELFGGRGFRQVERTQNNAQHADMLSRAMACDARFIFANFEDFDMLFGHRNDVQGFRNACEAFDPIMDAVLSKLTVDDLLILSADHGNDPTSESTDHSREYVPLCVARHGSGVEALGDLVGMNHVASLIACHLGVALPEGCSEYKF